MKERRKTGLVDLTVVVGGGGEDGGSTAVHLDLSSRAG